MLIAVALLALSARPLAAQAVRPPHDSAQSPGAPIFSRRDAVIAGGFAATTVAMFPLDRRIAEQMQQPSWQEHRLVHHLAKDAELLAVPGVYLLGAGAYAAGRLAHDPWLATTAVRAGESVAAGSLLAGVVKVLTGRARPYVVADTNAFDFAFGRGIRHSKDYSSFPSIHTVTAFAAASSVTMEVAHRWPRAAWYVGPVLYGEAGMLGVMRMYHDKHWASDVACGAAIGTFSGIGVSRWNARHRDNWLDRLLLETTVVPTAHHGVEVRWSVMP